MRWRGARGRGPRRATSPGLIGAGPRRLDRPYAAAVLEIVFETHSTSVDNERGIATGWLPGRLSKRGRRQAEELGARRRDDGLVAVYTSDLARAVDTAEIAFAGNPLPIYRDAR